MRKIYIITFLLSISGLLSAQKYFDIGVTGGASYYLGEINPSRQFYAPSPSYGGFIRYNLNSRQALKASIIQMSIKGTDADFNNFYQKMRGASFNASFTEASAVFEFNFLPYYTHKKEKGFSPYLYGGIGYLAFVSAVNNKGNYFSVPFGMGVKYTISKRIGTGVEWGMRKLFNDQLDGLTNAGGDAMKSFINNNDWYSFAGFFISFRLYDDSGDCPVYW